MNDNHTTNQKELAVRLTELTVKTMIDDCCLPDFEDPEVSGTPTDHVLNYISKVYKAMMELVRWS